MLECDRFKKLFGCNIGDPWCAGAISSDLSLLKVQQQIGNPDSIMAAEGPQCICTKSNKVPIEAAQINV